MMNENNDEPSNPWYEILYGIGALGFAYFIYDYCNALEQAGNVMHAGRSKWLISLLYNLGGKWTPTVVFVLVGLGLIGFGARGLMKKNN
jgi:hypothetical protein